MEATTISQFMTTQPWTISARASIGDATELMRMHAIRHLPVIDHGDVVGVVSDRDIKTLKAGQFSRSTRVREAIMDSPYVVRTDAPLADVARHMSENKSGAAVVVSSGGEISGIFTAVDACRALADVLGDGYRR